MLVIGSQLLCFYGTGSVLKISTVHFFLWLSRLADIGTFSNVIAITFDVHNFKPAKTALTANHITFLLIYPLSSKVNIPFRYRGFYCHILLISSFFSGLLYSLVR